MAITSAQYDLLVSPAVLQDALIDKDTGTVMAGGTVTFYQDTQRQTLKNVYYQTNAAGSYQYIPIPNPNILTASGCLSDPGGNAILPFFFPYEESNDTIIQKYYVTVVNAQNIAQFTLQNFPYIVEEGGNDPGTEQQNLLNLIPNPQFAAHNNFPNNLYPNGVSDVIVAPGGLDGWQFQKPSGSTDTDLISFNFISQEPNGLTGNPRWSINLSNSGSNGGDSYKQLTISFSNVNRFASLTQFYTLGFYGLNNNNGTAMIDVNLYKYFGSGGATPTTNLLAQFSLTNNWQAYQVAFVFGENNVAIGTNNDDYFELVFNVPAASNYDIQLTDFFLIPGQVTVTSFPQRTDNEVFADGIAGSLPIPDPNGGDLYLPIIYTPSGFNFDTSTIGNIYASLAPSTPTGYLYCDGSTYFTNQYNAATGIPYSRLGNFLYNNSNYAGIPLFGTGSNFATAYSSTTDTSGNLYVSANKAGTATPVSAGTTGFTVSTQMAGNSAAYGIFTQRTGSNSIFIRANASNTGSVITAPNAGTSGFAIALSADSQLSNTSFQVSGILQASSLATGSTGKYFTFSTPSTNFFVWYKVTTEMAPVLSGTGIMVQLVSTDTAADVTYKTLIALQASWLSRIVFPSGSGVAPGSNLSFTANGITYLPYYQVGSAAVAVPTGGTPILVSVLSADTAALVASKTLDAINSFAFAVPDFRGLLLRGTDPNAFWDKTAAGRAALGNNNYYGAVAGTFEIDTFQNHNHTASSNAQGATGGNGWPVPGGALTNISQTISIGYTGSNETRPVNAAVNWIIKY